MRISDWSSDVCSSDLRVKTGDRVSVLPFISCGKCLACLEGDPMGCGQARMMGSFGVTGGYAEYLLTNEIWCVKLPTSLSFEDGALVEPLAVSLRSARVSGIKPGDRVLVMGAGDRKSTRLNSSH